MKVELAQAFVGLAGVPTGISCRGSKTPPLGVRFPIQASGIFPAVRTEAPATTLEVQAIGVGPTGWTNYRSAEGDPEVCASAIQGMVDQNWAARTP